jgi:hypothetical protein
LTVDGRQVLAAACLVALVSACGAPAPSVPDAGVEAPAVLPRVGRSVCPGSVTQVGRDLGGAAADSLERLQGTYENDPGFLAVVWDGRRGVIVVESAQLIAWQARVAPLGIAVARSCVDPALLATVHAALPRIPVPGGGIISAGYDGLDDAIFVLGVDTDVLVAAMDEVRPGVKPAALAAIADGTLRVSPQEISGGRS